MSYSNKETKKNSTVQLPLIQLFCAFFMIGLTTFGGMMGMLTNLQHELVEKRKWMTDNDLYDFVAIAQCTPGIIMVNSATLLGAKKHGLTGSIVSSVAVVLPSLIIITLLAFLLSYFSSINIYLAKFLTGVRIAVCATALKTILNMLKKNITDIPSIILLAVFLLLFFYFKLPSTVLIIAGIICGISIRHFYKKPKEETKK